MSSIGGILSTAASALGAHQKALSVTAHNISNAETEGYSRQRAALSPNPPLVTPDGVIGTGVRVADIERVRDPLLDATWRRENASTTFHGERADQLGRIEEVFGEPSDTGLLATMDAFWNAWSDLAADPMSDAARSVVQERGQQVTDRLHQLANGLTELRTAGTERLDAFVDRVNELAEQVSDMNKRIVSAEAAGGQAGDLRDERDRAVDELSGLVGVQVVERERGDVGVYVDGKALVDGATFRTLETAPASGTLAIRFAGTSSAIAAPGGKVGGLLSVLNQELPDASVALNDFAADLVETVNALHRTGVSPDGATGVDFFFDRDPADPGVSASASDIRLSAAVAGDPRAIAAGRGDVSDPANPVYRAGAQDIALAMDALRDNPPTRVIADFGDPALAAFPADGRTFADRYGSQVARVGSGTASARASRDVHDALSRQADIRRESVSGVSIDEELTLMIRQQAAYGAAARIVSRVDEMLQTLIGMV